MRLYFFAALFILIAVPASSSSKQYKVLEVEATGPNRRIAYDECLRQIGEQLGGVIVQSRSKVKNFELQEDVVSVFAEAAIPPDSVKVISEAKDGDTYRMHVRATIDMEAVIRNFDRSRNNADLVNLVQVMKRRQDLQWEFMQSNLRSIKLLAAEVFNN